MFHICIYVCMYVCMYVYMHVCMYVCMCIYMYIYVYIYMYIYTHTYVYVYTHDLFIFHFNGDLPVRRLWRTCNFQGPTVNLPGGNFIGIIMKPPKSRPFWCLKSHPFTPVRPGGWPLRWKAGHHWLIVHPRHGTRWPHPGKKRRPGGDLGDHIQWIIRII